MICLRSKFSNTLVGLSLIGLFSGCTTGESEEITKHLNESAQFREFEQYDEILDFRNSKEKESKLEIQFIRETSYGSTDDVIVGIMGPIAVDRNGRVFITDKDQKTVHVFQPEGSYLTSLGRQGRGPGEFMGVTAYTTVSIHSDLLYITDQSDSQLQFPYRVHEFSLENLSFSRTIDLLAKNKNEFEELNGYYSKNINPFNDGTFLVAYHQSPNEYQDKDSFIYYVVQDTSGTIISGPIFIQKDLTNLTTEVTNTPIPYTAIHSFPFHGRSMLTVSRGNNLFAINHSEEFKIDIYTQQGEYVRNIEHPFENVPFNKNELLDDYEMTNYGHRLGDGVALKMIREADNLPETWPALAGMFMDDEDQLWVSAIVEDFDVYEWWVLEDTGELIAKFEWSRDEPVEVIKNGYMYTRETDEETGLQQIVRYRIEFEEV